MPSGPAPTAETALAEFVCAPVDLAEAFIRLTAHSTFPLDRLGRYEHMLWRQARQIIATLKKERHFRSTRVREFR